MRYLCTNCNYIYDESIWDSWENIVAWTKFDNLWDHFACPVCSELAEEFQEIKEEISYINEQNPFWFEQEHFINYKIFDWDLEVQVWKWDLHASWPEHRISWIWLYDEYWDFVNENFLSDGEDPISEFDISDLDDFEIRVKCTIHWVWGRKIER